MSDNVDTIAAVSTPAGTGGIGIVRVSGPDACDICRAVTGDCPAPRLARLMVFRDVDGTPIDRGLVIYFPAPHSFTGEDVVELQGHGGDTVMDMLLERVCRAGARLARPGEFSERAFVNGRIDLVQAEAVADLIESATREAARLAMKSLSGAFSLRIAECADAVLQLRTLVEAAIDFPEEEIDFLAESDVGERLARVRALVARTLDESSRGAVVRGGLEVVLCGAPNAGKSSLLNALAGRQRAIVSATPGTTRDTVDERISVGGVVINLVDTAGLRDSDDAIEKEGIRRALEAIERADLAVVVCDDGEDTADLESLLDTLPGETESLVVHNKIDVTGRAGGARSSPGHLWVSAKTGEGVDALEQALLDRARRGAGAETMFLARRRHVDALGRTLTHLEEAGVEAARGNGELVAESLRIAHRALGEITGEVTSDELLGHIFSSFCIGK